LKHINTTRDYVHMKNNNNKNINVIKILKLQKVWTNKHNGDQDKL